MKIIITHYNRLEFLKLQLAQLKGYDVTVIDDGSDCDLSFVYDLIKFPHLGKYFFWIIWRKVLETAKKSKQERIMVIPDDFIDLDLQAIENLDLTNKAINIINDGREKCWNNYHVVTSENGFKNVGFVDCGFIAEKSTFEKLSISKPPKNWFNTPFKSSSIGYQLTRQLAALKIDMLTPIKSLAYHGNHISQMHPRERKNMPLISI